MATSAATTSGPVLGIDFGTSNSAAGIFRDGKPYLIEIEPGQKTLPTTFFFDFENRQTLVGSPANNALIDGLEGRFMRALKRVLGTSLMHEKRQLMNERVNFVDIISRFLTLIRERAEAATGQRYTRVLSGRPVRFHTDDPGRDAQAESDLRACYLAAGFQDVQFMPEPEAAAIACARTGTATSSIGLIVDIGGGTSDFSLFETSRSGTVNILASHGIRIGGTDFDRAISINCVMPLLGKGTLLRKEMGPGTLTAPNSVFNDLATWEKIQFLYTARTRNLSAEMKALALEPQKLNRLLTTIESELGHDIAFAVERGKIEAGVSAGGVTEINLRPVEAGLSASLSTAMLEQALKLHADAIVAAANQTLSMASCARLRVDRIIYVGGSTLLPLVSDAVKNSFPQAEHIFSEVFTAVADGLAIASAR